MSIFLGNLSLEQVEERTGISLTDDDRLELNGVRQEKAENCPITEIPPHGRLIDADALMDFVPLMDGIKIENAPTIIEAEE